MRIRGFGAARSLGEDPLLASAADIAPDIFHAMSSPLVRNSRFVSTNRQQFQRLVGIAAARPPTRQAEFVSRSEMTAARFAATDAE
jgi:hypothetical protein